jgi:hypothetical protein
MRSLHTKDDTDEVSLYLRHVIVETPRCEKKVEFCCVHGRKKHRAVDVCIAHFYLSHYLVPVRMASDPFLSAEHVIELNDPLTAAMQRALTTQEDKQNTRRAYEPKQREFIVYRHSSIRVRQES